MATTRSLPSSWSPSRSTSASYSSFLAQASPTRHLAPWLTITSPGVRPTTSTWSPRASSRALLLLPTTISWQTPPDSHQNLTYNWSGTIMVPAPCQNAHKLPFFIGQNLNKPPSALLADKLFYMWIVMYVLSNVRKCICNMDDTYLVDKTVKSNYFQ